MAENAVSSLSNMEITYFLFVVVAALFRNIRLSTSCFFITNHATTIAGFNCCIVDIKINKNWGQSVSLSDTIPSPNGEKTILPSFTCMIRIGYTKL